jgi:hypothetical protein
VVTNALGYGKAYTITAESFIAKVPRSAKVEAHPLVLYLIILEETPGPSGYHCTPTVDSLILVGSRPKVLVYIGDVCNDVFDQIADQNHWK